MVKLAQIPRLIEEGTFKKIMLPVGHYYINQDGEVISINHTVPRIIPINSRATGEKDVVLFIPHPTVFGLAELLLTTFGHARPDNTAPCYRDFNPVNVSLDNVYWGDMEAQLLCRNKLNLKHIEDALITQDKEDDPYKITAIDSMIFVNKVLLQDLMGLSVALNRICIDGNVKKDDINGVRQMLTIINDISNLNMVKKEKISALFNATFGNDAINQAILDFRALYMINQSAYQKG